MARLLSRGTTGLDVNELQAALNFHVRSPATPLRPDGIFGPLTEARVRDFQKRAQLKVDGLVGPSTIAVLYRRVAGVVVVQRKPRVVASVRSLNAFRPGFGQVRPANPDVLPPQTRSARSLGFELETKLVFNPLAKPSLGDHPLQLTLSKSIPWPIFLPEPLLLDVDAGLGGKFELDGKIKVPFKLLKTDRLELKPYFFVGGGVEQNHFKDINIGAGSKLKLKLVKDPFGSESSISVEADGGVKYKHDFEKNEGKIKGYVETSVVLTIPFNLF
jgi:hypothetical protein